MASYNFYLKNRNSNTETPVLLYISYNSTFCKISTGLKILPNKWNYKKQKLKSQSSKSTETNNILNNILTQAEKTYLSLVDEGVYITNEVLKKRFKLNITPIKKLNLKSS